MARSKSIADVAAAAGVSIGTVSNVLNHPHVVAAGTREKVEAAIRELGFVRNESARQLGSGRSRAIGLVVLDIGNPFFTDIARGAQQVTKARGGLVLIADSAEDPELEKSNVEMFLQQRVQGVLIAPSGADLAFLDVLDRAGIPAVVVDRASNAGDKCAVTVDDRLGGALAARHLLSLGHRHLAIVGGPSTQTQVEHRTEGALRATAEAGATLMTVSTRGLNVAEGRMAAQYLATLPDDERPTAVFAANDLVALGLLQGLVTAGLRVPQDMSLIGYDDIEFSAAATVPLTSMRQPREELGRAAAELLYEEIDQRGIEVKGGAPHRHRLVQFHPELVIRSSTALAPAHAVPSVTASAAAASAVRRRR